MRRGEGKMENGRRLKGKNRKNVVKILGICVLVAGCLACYYPAGAELAQDLPDVVTATPQPSPASAEETAAGLSLQSLEPDCQIICTKKTNYGKEDDRYVCVVFQHPKNKKRILYVIKEFKDGNYQLLAKNSSIILREDEGGMMGDPFLPRNLTLKRDKLDIKFYGGSGWLWMKQYTFRIQKDEILLTRYKDKFGRAAGEMYGSITIHNSMFGGEKTYYYPQKGLFKMMKRHESPYPLRKGKLVRKKIIVKKEKIDLNQFDGDSFMKKISKLEKRDS